MVVGLALKPPTSLTSFVNPNFPTFYRIPISRIGFGFHRYPFFAASLSSSSSSSSSLSNSAVTGNESLSLGHLTRPDFPILHQVKAMSCIQFNDFFVFIVLFSYARLFFAGQIVGFFFFLGQLVSWYRKLLYIQSHHLFARNLLGLRWIHVKQF